MRNVYKNIFVGSTTALPTLPDESILLNLSSKYHYSILGWTKGTNHSQDPEYLWFEDSRLLSVNWVDGAARYFDYQGKGVKTCEKILDFIEAQEENVYIFCDMGESRAPSIALLYLAKRAKVIPDKSFLEAKKEFTKLYSDYSPGWGIKEFLTNKWDEII